MDDDSPLDAQFRSESTVVNHGSAPYAGAFFPRSRNLTVSGGTFISNNYNEPAMPADFRRIPLGDIDLRNEIRLHEESGVIDRQRSRGCVRRMYSAKINGKKSNMTVVLYEGDNAEEEWWDTISKHSRLRHPNVLQIFAVASSAGIHAIVAHDDLIPFNDFLQLHCDSPILTVCIHACSDRDKDEAWDYFKHMFGSYLDDDITTFWIRRSTGRLCVDLTPGDVLAPYFSSFTEWTLSFDHIPSWNDPNSEAMVIDSLELGEYHEACYWHLGHRQSFPVSVTEAELHLGAVVYSPSGSELDGSDEIAFLPDANLDFGSWYGGGAFGDTMEDGWTRYNSAEIFGALIASRIFLEHRTAWLSQANHIFHRLQIKSNYEDYAIIEVFYFQLRILEPGQTPPNGYLFVCPTEDLRTGAGSCRWPDCPAYWSLDPSGAEHLSTDEATHLGFPSINLETEVETNSWDASLYVGLHKFHEGKGFHPDSQDVALHLGHHLYQLCPEMEVPFAHVDEVLHVEAEREASYTDATEDEDGDGPIPEDADGEVSYVEPGREHSSTATTEDEDGDGSAPEYVDGEIPETEAERKGSSPATNEDEDRDELTPQEKCASLHSDVELSWSWKAIMFVKLGLTLALGFGSLCEYGRAVLSQQDI